MSVAAFTDINFSLVQQLGVIGVQSALAGVAAFAQNFSEERRADQYAAAVNAEFENLLSEIADSE